MAKCPNCGTILATPDAYKILGIAKTASQQEVKQAYLRQAAKYHPDKDVDPWVFQQVQDAYEQLTSQTNDRGWDLVVNPQQVAQEETPHHGSAFRHQPRRRAGYQTGWLEEAKFGRTYYRDSRGGQVILLVGLLLLVVALLLKLLRVY